MSEREREILRLVATGATNQQIANQLNISINTVKVHLRNIFGKIGVASRTEATVYAIRQGLVQVDEQTQALYAVSEPPTAPDAIAAVAAEEAPVAPSVAVLPMDTPLQEEVATVPALERPTSRPVSRPWLLISLLGIVVLVGVLAFLFWPRTQVSPQPAVTAVPEEQRWIARAALPDVRANFAVVSYEGRVYAIGGQNATQQSLATVVSYDPASDSWSQVPAKPTAASFIQAAAIRGMIYVPGGESADGQTLRAFEAFDLRTQQWETLPDLPEPRSHYALVAVEGLLYLFGGWDGQEYRAEVFIYDPATRSWSTGRSMPTPRRDAGAALVDDRVYVVGGENASGALQTNERYEPASGDGGNWTLSQPLEQPIAAPAVASVVKTVIVFDPERHTSQQYQPSSNSWSAADLPADLPLSSQSVAREPTIYLFGPLQGDSPITLSEYQPFYTFFVPSLRTGD